MPDDARFDVQRQSPLTPEGQIESAGRFARGLGARRMRRYIGATLILWIAMTVFLIAASL